MHASLVVCTYATHEHSYARFKQLTVCTMVHCHSWTMFICFLALEMTPISKTKGKTMSFMLQLKFKGNSCYFLSSNRSAIDWKQSLQTVNKTVRIRMWANYEHVTNEPHNWINLTSFKIVSKCFISTAWIPNEDSNVAFVKIVQLYVGLL